MWFTALLIAAEESGGTGGSSWLGPVIMIALFGAVFYFLLWRPQQKRMRSQMEMMESIRVGDEVVTQGGIYGYVTELEDDTLLMEVSEGVEVRVAKSSVYRNLSAAERQESGPGKGGAKEAENEGEEEGGNGEDSSGLREGGAQEGAERESGD